MLSFNNIKLIICFYLPKRLSCLTTFCGSCIWSNVHVQKTATEEETTVAELDFSHVPCFVSKLSCQIALLLNGHSLNLHRSIDCLKQLTQNLGKYRILFNLTVRVCWWEKHDIVENTVAFGYFAKRAKRLN